ncbi:hypothetical protein [Algoriphagus terrigena]|uniref:hypothetical protein n=1 Tax=Algoriphagus terrigena TaxID=344884 RepID=UPI000420B414|nr:hypothetical protein [Algoriphagus terrigena]
MNNYTRLLLYLKQFEGDGIEHPVEQLLSDKPEEEIRSILQELSEEGLIKYSGKETRYMSFIVETNPLTSKTKWTESPFNEHIRNSEPKPFKAKITFKGSKYLKEELQMQEQGKYNISVHGQGATNNFVIESQNVSIGNSTKFSTKADSIIEAINLDSSVDDTTKQKIINDIVLAKSQVENHGRINPGLAKQILEYGSSISSIGQLVMGLFAI